MSDETHSEAKPRNPGRVFNFIGLTLLGLVVLYVLSIGSAVLMLHRHLVTEDQLSVFYLPLVALGQKSPAAYNLLSWYISLWV